MDFEVRHIDGTTVKLISSEHKCAITSATQTRKLCGNDTVTINLQSATYIEFQVGDKITIFGTTYTLNQLPTVKKESERSYTYTLVFEGLQYTLIDRVFLMPDNTQGDNLMFDLAGMLRELATNINRGNSGKQYVFELDESLEETEYKNLSLTGKNCLQVLQQLCQEWDTEFVIAEEPTRIAIYIGVAGSTFPTTFKYGRGGGVYELNREKGASDICTRLFVYGGTQNLTYYRHNRLCLPSKEKNQSYVEDATAQAVYGIKEQVKNFDDIYPNRIGTITSLSGCDYNEFIDSAMADAQFGFDLNEKWANNADDCEEWLALKGLEDTPENEAIYYNDVAGTATKYLMAGATAKIHFNTGALAGYECDLHAYTHSNQKFVLKPLVDENGYDFPSKTNAAFKLAVGDEYVILDINLPTAYKTQAESKLATEAASYFETVCRPQPKYTLTIEPIALKHIVGPSTADTEIFKVGDLINISDPTGGVESATIRIDQFVRNLLDSFDYKLTLTDEITYSQQVRTLIEVDAIKRVVEESKIYDVNRIRRGWKDAEELYNQMFDTEGHYYSEKIAPLSIDTQMLKVGARSQQLVLQNVLFQPNYNANPANLQISAGSLVHYTIAEPDIKTWTMSAYSGSNVPSTAQYVYAKCAKNGTTGTWLVTDQAIIFDSDPSYYHFLVGSLSSVDSVSNTRNFAATYGFTTINGRNITTGVIKSSDGSSVVIDLDAGIIKGNITFESGTTSYDALQSIIGNNSTVQSAATTANTAKATANRAEGKIDGLEIGGRNLLQDTNAPSLTKVCAPYNRYVSSGSASSVTYTFEEIANPPCNVKYAIQFVRPAGVATERSLTWYAGGGTVKMVNGAYYTLSAFFRLVSGNYGIAYLQYGADTYKAISLDLTSTEWQRLSFTFQYDASVNLTENGGARIYIGARGRSSTEAYTVQICGFKLEKGTVPTDWTPAPEDVTAEIEAEAAAQTAALTNLAASVASDIESLQDQIDGKVETWFGDYEPTLNNEPASTWRAEGKESDHLGDMFYDNTTGYAYRFANTGTTASPVYAWLDVSDSAVVEALTLAREAKTAADGKMQVFVAQPVPPYEEGDMWVQGANGDIKYCATARESGAFVASDWVIASKYTDDTAANAAQSAADAAQTMAENAETHAQSALADLTNYASDSKVSPTEKPALKQQLADINAEKDEIVKQATLYSLLTSTEYTDYYQANTGAYQKAVAALNKYTAATPSHIAVESDYADIAAYYPKRQAVLDKIAETAQNYADDAALTAVSNLQIGGRNLLLGVTNPNATPTPRSCTYTCPNVKTITMTATTANTNAQVYYETMIQNYAELAGKEVTLSIEKVEKSNANTKPSIYLYNNGGTLSKRLYLDADTTNGYQYSFTFPSIPENTTKVGLIVRANQSSEAGGLIAIGDTVTFVGLKLEKGNKATDWTPAPEDTEAELTALQTDLQGQIDSKIETWSQVADPSTAWTTTALRDKHEGDLWQYTGTTTTTRTHNATYRWSGSAWVEQEASSELFDKIDGKAAIWYGSTSDHPAQGETVSNGDFLVDGATGKTYKYAPTQTPNENGWVNVQDYQTPIATLDLRLDNIDSDTVFSVSEKENYRTDFEKIVGLGIPVAGYIPTAAELAEGSYNHGVSTYDCSKGTFYQHYSLIRATATNTLGALSQAYTNLRSFLVNVELYVNTDYGTPLTPFSRTALAELICAYLDAEKAIDLYASTVGTLTATTDTAESTQRKELTINTPEGVTSAMLSDMLVDEDMRMLIHFDNKLTTQSLYFGLPVIPNGVSGDTARFSYMGRTTVQQCKINVTGAEFVVKFSAKSSSYVTYIAESEQALQQDVMFSGAMALAGGVYGGLALLSLLVLRNAAGQQMAGMNGLDDSDLAFWAGGALEEALNNNVPVWIKRNGSARFGKLRFDNGRIYWQDGGTERFVIQDTVGLQTANRVFNPSNQNDNNTFDTLTNITITTINSTSQSSPTVATIQALQALNNATAYTYYNGMDVYIEIQVSLYCTNSGTGGTMHVILQYTDNGSTWYDVPNALWNWNLAPSTTGESQVFDPTLLSFVYNASSIPSSTGYKSAIGLRMAAWKDSGLTSVSFDTSGTKWHYYKDISKMRTAIGKNGFGVMLNANNLFSSFVNNNDTELTTTIKGNTDIPGVLWAGNISSGASVLPHYKNAAKYANSQLECDNWNSTNKYFRITHRLGTGNFTAMVTPCSSAVTARTTKDGTYLYVYLSAQASFDLVLFGTN